MVRLISDKYCNHIKEKTSRKSFSSVLKSIKGKFKNRNNKVGSGGAEEWASISESVCAVIGSQRSVRYMFYVVAEEFVRVYAAENSNHAGFTWRSRREQLHPVTSYNVLMASRLFASAWD
ncbi:hypothetical protein GOBAR_DD36387 [Gossypium barbadense]|nr:hypothetical protein GOBAR_DD36387 [Gossypium barbadense]